MNFFDELYVYSRENSTWRHVFFSHDVPKLAGHTASVINENYLILFGGCDGSLGNKTNAVHCLDLSTSQWLSVSNTPKPRISEETKVKIRS